jgi:hypothetical protein
MELNCVALMAGCPATAGFVAPRGADVGEHGGEVGVGEIRTHWRHIQIPILVFHLEIPVQSGQRDLREAMEARGNNPFGAGERRCHGGFAHAVVAVADTADGFIDFLALRRRSRRAGLGLIQIQLFNGDVRAVNLGVEPAAVMVEIHAAEKKEGERQHDYRHRNGRVRRHRLAARACGTIQFGFVVHGLVITGVNGAS